MYSQSATLDTLDLPSNSAVAGTMDNYTYNEGSYAKHLAVDPTSSIHPLFSHPERHLILNEISFTADDFRHGLQLEYPANCKVAPGAEYTDGWMSSPNNGQKLEVPGSSNLSLSSFIPFPSSVSAAWTSSSNPSPAEIYNKMTTNESESMDFDGSNATQGSLSFWIVDSEAGTKHYQCECGKITKNKGDMRRHRQSLKHSGRGHRCPCGGIYTRQDSLKRHAQVCSYAAGDLNNA